ncbi:polysaccharide ABC transporter ATP-binding protein [uncultured Gemmiger sp.]|uniref:ABC transporter ATP-binding protein n=1 Tax=uncultured Gemmiger sp. TaxID=1623490 RepID=UPI002612C0D3|nr:polysaccharide ABC transporter ATP-binding protein [uncultured Gemmiger sp.]
MSENQVMVQVENVKKQYRLGQIGGGTLRGDLQSWWARKCGKEDPNTLIGTDQRLVGTTFMALNGVSFTVNKGEAVGIIGSNGAGKSTLLKLLTHVTAPTEGSIDLYGRVASMLEVGTGFHPEMTGRENVYLNGAILGMTRAEIDAKMNEIIEFSEVGDFIDTPVKRYSSGMYVKLAFSVAAHLDSEIMIMDEVLAVGDMKFQKKCLTKMRQAAKKDGRTVLYVSHNMATIRELCDRCIVLDKGKIVFDGDTDEAIARYLETRYTTQNRMDYSTVTRADWITREFLRFHSIWISGEADCLERTKTLRMNYEIQAVQPMKRVGLHMEIKDELGAPIATTGTYELELAEGKNCLEIGYDLSNLMPGKYTTYFTLFTMGDNGKHDSEDVVPGMMLNVVDTLNSNGLEWVNRAWGAIRLPDGRLENSYIQ